MAEGTVGAKVKMIERPRIVSSLRPLTTGLIVEIRNCRIQAFCLPFLDSLQTYATSYFTAFCQDTLGICVSCIFLRISTFHINIQIYQNNTFNDTESIESFFLMLVIFAFSHNSCQEFSDKHIFYVDFFYYAVIFINFNFCVIISCILYFYFCLICYYC